MIVAQLFIEGTRVDMYDDVSIVINDSIKKASDVGKVFTAYTQSFKLPASKTNNKIFKHYYDAKVLDGFDARRKHSATLKINGANYQKGYIKLNGVDVKNNVAESYNVQFFGELTSLKERFKEDKLYQLDYLDYLNHDFNITNVRLGFETGFNVVSGTVTSDSTFPNIIYPFLSHTRGFTYSTNHGLYDITKKGQGSVNSTDRLNYTDLKPAVRVREVLTAIEQKYSLEFGGDFIQSNLFNELYIWCHKTKGGIVTDDTQTNVQFWESSLTELTLDTYTKDTGDPGSPATIEVYDQDYGSNDDWDKYAYVFGVNYPVDANNEFQILTYTLPFDNKMDYDCTLTVTPSGSFTADYNVFVWDSVSGEYYVAEYDLNGGSGSLTFTIDSPEQPFTIGAGDLRNIQIRVTSDGLDEFDIQFDLNGERVEDGTSKTRSWSYTKSVTSAELITYVKVPFNLPAMKVTDFISSLLKLFNLVAYAQPKNNFSEDYQIILMPLDEFYENGKTLNISEYVDISSSQVERVNPYGTIRMRFDEPSTFLATKRNELTGTEFGNATFTTGDFGENSEEYLFDGGEYVIENKLEKILYERITDTHDDTLTELIYGWFVNDFSQNTPEPEIGSPLLFFRNNRSCTTDTIEWEDATTTNTTYNAPSNVSSDQGQTLHYNVEFDEYTLDANDNSLFENYYKNYIQGIYSIDARKVMVNAYLPSKFIFQYNLNDKIIINNIAFNIDNLKINLLTGKSTLTLNRITAFEQTYPIISGSSYSNADYVAIDYWNKPYSKKL